MSQSDNDKRRVINALSDAMTQSQLCLVAELCDEPAPASSSISHVYDVLSRIWVKSHAVDSLIRNGGVR